MITTVDVHIVASDQNGNRMAGAPISARLSGIEVDVTGGYVFPEIVKATADANGEATLSLWPNALGSTETFYEFKITNPDTGKTGKIEATIPNADCELHLVANLPPYPGKSDGQLAVDVAVAAGAAAALARDAAAVSEQAAADSAMAASEYASGLDNAVQAAATSEANALGSASAAAVSAADALGSKDAAAVSAQSASDSADAAGDARQAAQTAAGSAQTSAESADARATVAEEKAENAAASAIAAADSALAASTSEQNASDSENAAAISAGNAEISENAAAQSAGDASDAAASLTASLFALRRLYLGEHEEDPAVDGNGNPLVEGASYFNTVSNKARVYSEGAWGDYDATAQAATQSAVLAATAAAQSESNAGSSASAAAASRTAAEIAKAAAELAAENLDNAVEDAEDARDVAQQAAADAHADAIAASNSAADAQAAMAGKMNVMNPTYSGILSGGGIHVDSAGIWADFHAQSASSSYMSFRKGGSSNFVGLLGTDGGGAVAGGSGNNFAVRSTGDLILTADSGCVRAPTSYGCGLGTLSLPFGDSWSSSWSTRAESANDTERPCFRACRSDGTQSHIWGIDTDDDPVLWLYNTGGAHTSQIKFAKTYGGMVGNIAVNNALNAYGSIAVVGSKNGYAGIDFPVMGNGSVLMTNGTICGWYSSGGGWLFTADTSGNFTATGNFGAYSDERLKKDWRPVCKDFVRKWAKVKRGIFTRIDTGEVQAGLGAQSAQKVLPQVVSEVYTDAEKTKKILSLNYGAAAAVATGEIAEYVVALEDRIIAQEKQIEELCAMVQSLAEKVGL